MPNAPHAPTCPRCAGYLATEHTYDYPPETWLELVYCVNCGWRTDQTIAANLARPPLPIERKTHKRRLRRSKYGQRDDPQRPRPRPKTGENSRKPPTRARKEL